MKKTMITLFVVLFGLSSAFAQLPLESFKVKDGLAKANSLIQSKGITNPQMIFAGTVKKDISYSTYTVSVDFNIANGTSNAWFYIFRSADNPDQKICVFVVKVPILGYQGEEIPIQDVLGGIPIDVSIPLSDASWVDSDRMAELFRNYSEISDYMTANPTIEGMFVGILINANIDFLLNGAAVWVISMNMQTDPKTCGLNNTTEEVLCGNLPTGITEYSETISSIFPNPSEDYVSISLNDASDIEIQNLRITDILGNRFEINDISIEDGSIRLNVSTLQDGVYFISLNSGKEVLRHSFVKR